MTLKSVRGDPLPWVSGFVSVLNVARNHAWVLACMLAVRQRAHARSGHLAIGTSFAGVVCFEELANA
jgi:hypothetical protein